jgi:hypothetical protein
VRLAKPATTLSQFSWRDPSRRSSHSSSTADSADSQERTQPRQQASWPLILHQELKIGPDPESISHRGSGDRGGSPFASFDTEETHSSSKEADNAADQAWDESFLLGVMQKAAVSTAAAPAPARDGGSLQVKEPPSKAPSPPAARPSSEWPVLIVSTHYPPEPAAAPCTLQAGCGPDRRTPRRSAAGAAPPELPAAAPTPRARGGSQWPTLVASSVVLEGAGAPPTAEYRRLML